MDERSDALSALFDHRRSAAVGRGRKRDGTAFEVLDYGRYNILPRNQMTKLPAFLANSRALARLIDMADNVLGALLPWFCQNWYFIMIKRP